MFNFSLRVLQTRDIHALDTGISFTLMSECNLVNRLSRERFGTNKVFLKSSGEGKYKAHSFDSLSLLTIHNI